MTIEAPVAPSFAMRLRDELTANERQIVIMHETPDGVVQVIRRMDQIDTLLLELRATRYDARAEQNRAEALRGRLTTRDAGRAAKLVRASGQAALLADSPTWRAIAAVDVANRRARNRRWGIGAALLTTAALLLFVVLPWLFPAPPQAEMREVATLSEAGRTDDALAKAQAEYARVPSDPQSLLWIGALQQRRGAAAAAQATWAQARAQYGDDAFFYSDRSLVLFQLKEYAGAQADARQLLSDPQAAPQGQYMLGQILEEQGKRQEAIAAYEEAARLADAQNNAQITVAAKTRIGFIMQRPPDPKP